MRHPERIVYLCGAVAALLAVATAGLAQRGRFRAPAEDDDNFGFAKDSEFHFLRVEYTDLFRRGFGFRSRGGEAYGWWSQDWPDADNHFSLGIQRLTRINLGDPRHMRLTDERIFDYPWIYATQTGYWNLSRAETDRLRDYLLRGGFLVVDDMWGQEELDFFSETMARALPNRPITELAETDQVMHVLYDIRDQDRTFIPGSRHLRRGPGGTVQIAQPPGTSPAWFAMHDDKDHMIVAVNYDTDVADAWEFADVPYYPEKMTTLAYRYGINYIIYSMTH